MYGLHAFLLRVWEHGAGNAPVLEIEVFAVAAAAAAAAAPVCALLHLLTAPPVVASAASASVLDNMYSHTPHVPGQIYYIAATLVLLYIKVHHVQL